MEPKTKIQTKRDRALIFDTIRFVLKKQAIPNKERQNVGKILAEMGFKIFGGLNQKSGSISISGI